jgi:integrase
MNRPPQVIVGAKLPLRPMHVWAIRVRLQIERRVRDLALFDIALDSKLRGCDVVSLRLTDILGAGAVRRRAIVIEQKTGRPVQFEITERARRLITEWLRVRLGDPDGWLFPSRMVPERHLSTRQYIRLVKGWIALIGLEPSDYGSHSLRRTKVSMLYRRLATSGRASSCWATPSWKAPCATWE